MTYISKEYLLDHLKKVYLEKRGDLKLTLSENILTKEKCDCDNVEEAKILNSPFGKKSVLKALVNNDKDKKSSGDKEINKKSKTEVIRHIIKNPTVSHKIIPQPSKGVKSSVSGGEHTSEEAAQKHIDRLKSSGDKRNLIILKKAQFSQVVKEEILSEGNRYVVVDNKDVGAKEVAIFQFEVDADNLIKTLKSKGDKRNLTVIKRVNIKKYIKMNEETLEEENDYIAFYDRRQLTIKANTSLEARDKAVVLFKPKKSEKHLVHVVLARKDGKGIIHTPVEGFEILSDDYIGEDAIDIFFDEETNEEYYLELDEETLEEARFIIRVNAKGKRSRKLKCPKGKVVKTVNGRKMCANQGGAAKLKKRLAIRKGLRTKRSKGAGAKKRANIKRQRAIKRRRALGL